jgi:hypothetical protein
MATTTPNYGWDVPTSTDYVKDGATAIETLGDDIDATLWTALGGAYPGLRLIKKQTIGTGVSTVTVTGAFSAAYENYKIIVTGGTASVQNLIGLRLGTTAAGYYSSRVQTPFSSGVPAGGNQSNTSSWIYAGAQSLVNLTMNVELFQPFVAKQSFYTGTVGLPSTTGELSNNAGYLDNTTSYTSFEIFPNGGTITGGTIYVYGYGVS